MSLAQEPWSITTIAENRVQIRGYDIGRRWVRLVDVCQRMKDKMM